MLKSAVWFITWNCNQYCPYCWERQRQKRGEFTPEPFLDHKIWVEAWNRLNPAILDITGGEPFMQPDFLELLEGLDPEIRIAITTNATLDLTQFVQRISPEKVFSMTISWHPTGGMNTDAFFGKCLFLINRGFNITINFVLYPEQMYLAPGYRNQAASLGIRFHCDPYAQTPHFPFTYTDKELKFVEFFTGADRANALTDEVRPVLCSAGMDHLTVYPDGSTYRCINDSIAKRPALGKIQDPEFKQNTEMMPCPDYNKCAGCNRDKVFVRDRENAEHKVEV